MPRLRMVGSRGTFWFEDSEGGYFRARRPYAEEDIVPATWGQAARGLDFGCVAVADAPEESLAAMIERCEKIERAHRADSGSAEDRQRLEVYQTQLLEEFNRKGRLF